jgi:sterol desaturase/sphingolipid hydroxylase (fatty acid hydroxylase superfamily)
MFYIFVFLSWTLCLYWLHRIVHITPVLKELHWDHHKFINLNNTKWHWNNLFLFNDTWRSTADLWVTEVLPTLLFSYVTGQWWVIIFYYVWASVLQETIEHNKNFNIYPILTSGRWHLKHHHSSKINFGLFFPMWDVIFKTNRVTT